MKVIPNPGSEEALKKGCSCPVTDNANGQGCGLKGDDGEPLFWISEDCRLHAKRERLVEVEA